MRVTKVLFGLTAIIAITGCQGRMSLDSLSSGVKTGDARQDQSLGLDQVDQSAKDLEVSINTSVAEIEIATNSGQFDNKFGSYIDLLFGKTQERLEKVLKDMHDKLEKARASIEDAKKKLDEKKASLDPNKPGYEEAVHMLESVGARLNVLEERINKAIALVDAKGKKLIVKLDKLISKLKKNKLLKLVYKVVKAFRGDFSALLSLITGL